MSQDAFGFAEAWAANNIYVEAYDPPKAVIDEHVERLVADAGAAGITRAELEEANGDLADFVAEKFDEATDAEVERLASKDD